MLPAFKNGEHMKKVWSSYKKVLDKIAFLDYNIKVAGVAQSVVQLIRNQQVVCSSHITSSKNPRTSFSGFYFFTLHSSLFTFHYSFFSCSQYS